MLYLKYKLFTETKMLHMPKNLLHFKYSNNLVCPEGWTEKTGVDTWTAAAVLHRLISSLLLVVAQLLSAHL